MLEDNKHWTRKTFLRKSDLFFPMLKDRIGKAKEEVDGLVKIFDDHGVPSSGLVLDLACGIGRHDTLLSKRGYNVIGIDISPKYLSVAKKNMDSVGKAERCSYILGDMRLVGNFFRSGCFNVSISIFTSIGYYDKETDISILKQLRELSHENGLLVVDMMSKQYGKNLDKRMILHSYKNGVIRIEESKFDSDQSRLEAKWAYYELHGDDLKFLYCVNFNNILYNPEDFQDMFRKAGWAFAYLYGGFNLSTYTHASKYIIVVASTSGHSISC